MYGQSNDTGLLGLDRDLHLGEHTAGQENGRQDSQWRVAERQPVLDAAHGGITTPHRLLM
jgi:hypothetical protein